MKKVFLGIGHGGADSGAIGNGLTEKDLNLKQGLICKRYLEGYGVEVRLSRYKDENDPLSEEIRESNLFDADLAIDIHTNSGGGYGFEVFHSTISSSRGQVLAQNINNEIVNAGYKSRGLKTKVDLNGRDYFGFIRETTCPAIITEMAFIDNKNDIKNFDEDSEIENYCICLVKGILKTLNIPYKIAETNFEDGSSKLYRVVCGAYKDKVNALRQQEKLQLLGINSFITRS
ncbi:MAG: N-acetylmuramoyl-L-alanine amidase [Sarcina sp.]